MMNRTIAFVAAIVVALSSGCGGHKPGKAIKGKFTEGDKDHDTILKAIAQQVTEFGVRIDLGVGPGRGGGGGRGKFNLTGDIEQRHLDRVTHLVLGNEISDLSPLVHLKNLKSL